MSVRSVDYQLEPELESLLHSITTMEQDTSEASCAPIAMVSKGRYTTLQDELGHTRIDAQFLRD
jgi:hypothetical protein